MREDLVKMWGLSRSVATSQQHPVLSQYNMLARGAEGAICQPPDLQKEGGWCYGYI